MSRKANIFAFDYDSKPTHPPDCGEESEADIAARELETQDRVDTQMLRLKRALRGGVFTASPSMIDIAENEVADFDEAARTLFIFYALDLEIEEYIPQSVRLAAKEYVEQVRAVLTKIESEKVE